MERNVNPKHSRCMYLMLLLIIFVPVLGQLQRFDIGSGIAFMLSDILIFLLCSYYVFYKIAFQRVLQINQRGYLFLLLWSVMLVSLIFGSSNLFFKEIIISSLYLFRFISYTLLYFVAKDVIKDTHRKNTVLRVLLVSCLLLAVLGFLQLNYFANFYKLQWYKYGWDPHINRLTSTWLDPNYLGGYLACAVVIMLSMAVFYIKKRQWNTSIILAITIAVLMSALMLTYSRSAYLALFGGLFVLGIIRLRKLVLVTMIVSFVVFSSSTRLQERVFDAYLSFKALFTESTYALDPTAQLRIQSWVQGYNMFRESPVLGIGYNTLKFQNMRYGYAPVDKHSAGGFDSSLLTVLTTTGVAGFIVYCSLFLSILYALWRIYLQYTDQFQYLALGLISACAGLFIHSFFVNSLFFPFIIVPFWIVIGMLDQKNLLRNIK